MSDMAAILQAASVNRSSTFARRATKVSPDDPMWKRVAKDRARKKAAKMHKKQLRRQGK